MGCVTPEAERDAGDGALWQISVDLRLSGVPAEQYEARKKLWAAFRG